MAKGKSLTELSAGLGENLVIKKRDPLAFPQTAPGRLMEFSAVAEQWQDRINLLEDELSKARVGATLFPINRLHKVSGRQRALSIDERNELLENLRNNPLDTPITVRKRSDGDWDIVSGNNRVDIYLQLGRNEIEGIEKNYSPLEADKQAFFSNLLHPSLPDFEKFKGFKLLMSLNDKTQDEIAKETGISSSTVSRIMSFNKLPDEAIELIKLNPFAVGAKTAETFATLLQDKKKKEVVIRSIKEIVEGLITQEAGIKQSKSFELAAQRNQRPTPINIRIGKKNYCKLISVKQTIRLDFETEEERMKMESVIKAALDNRAKELKK